jgi:glutamate/tyrosine decarboxylase-like PLP-dependent enzyme
MVRFEDAGRSRESVMEQLSTMHAGDIDWRAGRAPIFVFSATREVHALGQAAFNEYFSENALGARRAFPSLMRMEKEVVAMGLDLFHATDGGVGNMTSGGTESIVMAVKAARDYCRKRRANSSLRGNIVAPITVHPAFEKAAALMDLEIRHVSVTPALIADVAAMEARIDADTIMMVGSTPCFSYGVIDPIEDLAAVARRRGVWLHVDACVGGWMAPFVRDIGYPIPKFDFEVEGVMSLSADLHKFGFCPKPASSIFYRSAERQACQGFSFDTWPSGLFATQTLVGTRPGGAVAAAWAVLNHLGRDGYRAIARDHMTMRDAYLAALLAIPGMSIRGAPALMNIAFGCDDVDMGRVATLMGERGWLPGVVREPPSLHLMLSMQHEGARESYIRDVADCVGEVKAGRSAEAAKAAYS